MMKVNLCMDSPVERLCFQAGFQSIFQKVGENQAHINLVYGNVGWQSCICLERNVLPFCQSGIMADHAVSRLVFTKMQVVVWNFTVCIGKVFFYFFQISLFSQGRKLQKVMADIVSCLPCLLYGRAKVLISCLLKGEKMIFLLKPCIFIQAVGHHKKHCVKQHENYKKHQADHNVALQNTSSIQSSLIFGNHKEIQTYKNQWQYPENIPGLG